MTAENKTTESHVCDYVKQFMMYLVFLNDKQSIFLKETKESQVFNMIMISLFIITRIPLNLVLTFNLCYTQILQ